MPTPPKKEEDQMINVLREVGTEKIALSPETEQALLGSTLYPLTEIKTQADLDKAIEGQDSKNVNMGEVTEGSLIRYLQSGAVDDLGKICMDMVREGQTEEDFVRDAHARQHKMQGDKYDSNVRARTLVERAARESHRNAVEGLAKERRASIKIVQ